MKKTLLFLFLIFPLLASCNDAYNSNDEEPVNPTIDQRLIGRWKVEYSKTIRPAVYIENEEDLKWFSGYHIGVNYPETAVITEYFGDWEETKLPPESTMFNNRDIEIRISEFNNVHITPSHGLFGREVYTIEDGYFKWNTDPKYSNGVKKCMKYTIEGNQLTLELVKLQHTKWPNPYYIITRYSKIVE